MFTATITYVCVDARHDDQDAVPDDVRAELGPLLQSEPPAPSVACSTRTSLGSHVLPARPSRGRARPAQQGAGRAAAGPAASSRSRRTAARVDPASHAFRGPTAAQRDDVRSAPGGLYVYFTYGMHWCANVVCGEEGVAGAVLLRALAPLRGLERCGAARPAARRDRDLCSGPAKLCQALGIDRTFDGADLPTADRR